MRTPHTVQGFETNNDEICNTLKYVIMKHCDKAIGMWIYGGLAGRRSTVVDCRSEPINPISNGAYRYTVAKSSSL